MTLRRVGTEVRHLGQLQLWRDDLAEMVAVIREYEDEVTLSIKGYDLDDVEDLAQLPDSIKADGFVLETGSGRIRLVLSREKAAIEVASSDPATRGVAAEIERIASTKRRMAYSYRYALLAISAVVLLLGFVLSLR